MNRQLKKCPVCNGELEVIEYQCSRCQTSIRGRFRLGDLASLNLKQQEFVKVFICCGGNIKEVEKTLGISYPTVKNRLGEISDILCPSKEADPSLPDLLLADIESGKITVDEALEKFKKRR
ncbi:MAG: DUF2089 domain-containing protein [Candidatus Cloacimonetes bacterium]|nr:DUF2089 domain-containing protein [Candidatus Cloacimonadota bacterium]